jgi:DUF971 family protein
MDDSTLSPREIGRANQHDVRIVWQDGHESVYPARWLRERCPCAMCVDEMTGHVKIISSNLPVDVRPMAIELVGRYAMSVRWSDGHKTGIYPFGWLRRACPCCRPAAPAALPVVAPASGGGCGGGGGSCGCAHRG